MKGINLRLWVLSGAAGATGVEGCEGEECLASAIVVPPKAAFKLSVIASTGVFIDSTMGDTPTSGFGIPGKSGGSP